MIVAFLTFGFALLQVLLTQDIFHISRHSKLIVSIVLVVLSGIPLLLQFVLLLGELAWARNYFVKQLLHLMMMNILGSYGPTSNLVFKNFRRKKFGDYGNAKGKLWRSILHVGHAFAKFFGCFAFGDPFSGIFTVRHTSVTFWVDDEGDFHNVEKPKIDDDALSRRHVKDVRDLTLAVEFKRLEGQNSTVEGQSKRGAEFHAKEVRDLSLSVELSSTVEGQSKRGAEFHAKDVGDLSLTVDGLSSTVEGQQKNEPPPSGAGSCPKDIELQTMEAGSSSTGGNQPTPAEQEQLPIGAGSSSTEQKHEIECKVVATGSRDSLLSKLYREDWTVKCSKANALEFCILMESLNNDSFVVKDPPPDEADQILYCAELEDIVLNILKLGKKLNAKRVVGMSYV